MSVDPFVLKPSEYVRDINVLKHYVEQTALYISKMSGNTYEYCLDYVKRQVKEGGHFALSCGLIKDQKKRYFSKFIN